MADPNAFDFLRVPSQILVALDNRPLHYALQPWHHLVRMAHILSMATFFGGIVLLDLRLLGLRPALPVRPMAEHVLPWLYATFAIAVGSGSLLFLYDPVHVGSHAYFTLKLILVAGGLINAGFFHGTAYVRALATESGMPLAARLAGATSLVLWTGVVVCASLNIEAAPKVLLR
ncbi:MAG: hypothetical protein JNM75_01765 [Rhodospirillales bacterium]|nr:hypothetical protein [Rhodospirillales bacterium]